LRGRGACALFERRELVGQLGGKRPFGRQRKSWNGNINMDHKKYIVWSEMNFSGSG